MPNLILASTSPFRRELLERLQFPFSAMSPEIDESRKEGETARDLVRRLAEEKAKVVSPPSQDSLIIGSDQVAVLDEQILGKPGSYEKAFGQLSAASGRVVTFETGLCLYNAATQHSQCEVIPFRVIFRELTPQQISRYLEKEQPYNCAGSFKSEGLGSALFERLEGDDPTALIGLPLIRLCRMLENEGVEIL